MRIALTHPWCWPHVQRGGERLFADLSRYLVEAGHDIVTVSAGPRPRRVASDRHLVIEHRALSAAWLRRLDVDQPLTYLPQAAWSLRRAEPDVIHGMYHLDGLAARMARRAPHVVHLQGMPTRASLRGRPVHRRLFPWAVAEASELVVVSHAAAASLRHEFGLRSRVLHNGVHLADFTRSSAARSDTPSILFPGAPDDPRKRLDVLVEAIGLLAQRGRHVELHVASPVPAEVVERLRGELGPSVRFLQVRDPTQMVDAYRRSWITCSPAVREAFGLVFVEALASGRPAVGVRDGGVPEVIREPRWLAQPDDPGDLANTLDRALQDADEPGSEAGCRALSQGFDWSARGPAFEQLYEDITTGR